MFINHSILAANQTVRASRLEPALAGSIRTRQTGRFVASQACERAGGLGICLHYLEVSPIVQPEVLPFDRRPHLLLNLMLLEHAVNADLYYFEEFGQLCFGVSVNIFIMSIYGL